MTYGEDSGEPNTSPWVWRAGGQHFFWLALQTVGAHRHSKEGLSTSQGNMPCLRSTSDSGAGLAWTSSTKAARVRGPIKCNR